MHPSPVGKKALKHSPYQRAYLLLILGLAIYCILFGLHCSEPLFGDECWTPRIINSYIQGAIPAPGVAMLYHPPLHGFLLAAFSNIGGGSLPVIRLVGFLCHLAAAFLLFYCLKRFTEGWSYLPHLAFFLYLTHPLSIQSSLILDIDPGLLVPTIFLLFSALALSHPLQLRKAILASFLAFSTKLTTPFPIVFLGICLPLRSDRRERAKKIIGTLLGMTAAFLFIVATASYLHCSWTDPFTYALSALTQKSDWDITKVLLSLLRITLWLSPFLMVLAGWAIYHSFREDDPRLRAIALTILVVFLAYLIVGGVTHGYPKYHLPLLPLLFFLVGLHFLSSKDLPALKLPFWFVLILVCSFIFGFIMPDPLLLVNYQFREYLVAGEPLKDLYYGACTIGGLLFFTPVIIGVLLRLYFPKNPLSGILAATLLVCTIGYSLGMDTRQVRAAYATRYCYGESGTVELASLVRRLPQNESAMVPENVQILAGVQTDRLIPPGFWNNVTGVVHGLENPDVKLFAYSVSYNTIQQVRNFRRNEKLNKTLITSFTYKRIGTFDTWQRE